MTLVFNLFWCFCISTSTATINLTKNCALKLRFCRINFVQCLEQKSRLLIKTNIRDIEAVLYVSVNVS